MSTRRKRSISKKSKPPLESLSEARASTHLPAITQSAKEVQTNLNFSNPLMNHDLIFSSGLNYTSSGYLKY